MKLYIDQYGNKYHANTLKDLKNDNYLKGKIHKTYIDGKDGNTYHTGYCVGKNWFQVYIPLRELQNN